jgi:anti-sigma factor RsiW
MHQPNLDHSTHDLTLVAAHAAGDLPESDRHSAEALLATCADCADLHRDLIAIIEATRALPAPIARVRDFQLEPAQANRIRQGSWLRRMLRPFGAAGSSVRPIATAFTSLGIAGLLVATALPSLIGGSAASAPESDTAAGAFGPAATAAPAAAPVATGASAPGVPVPQAGGSTQNPTDYRADQHASGAPEDSSTAVKAGPAESPNRRSLGVGALASGGTTSGAGDGSFQPLAATWDTGPGLLFIGSLALLAIGLALFGLRFAGRRVR